jgi:hypothetical protein
MKVHLLTIFAAAGMASAVLAETMPELSGREAVIATFTDQFEKADTDADMQLTGSEWMDWLKRELSSSKEPGLTSNAGLLLQAHAAAFVRRDTNEDRFLTLTELLNEPLRAFDCMDEDRNGQVSEQEEGIAERCFPTE